LNIASTEEAEEFSKEWLKSKYHGKLAKHRFNEVTLEGGIWHLKAELQLKTGILSVERKPFSISVEASTGKVLGYKEGSDND
jgi:hypothetical protein